MSIQNLIWLSSYPKSGNTWLRFLLTNLVCKTVTQSADVEAFIPDIHLPATAQTLKSFQPDYYHLIKTHHLFSEKMPLAEKTFSFIYLVRHPLDVMFSNIKYYFLPDRFASETEIQEYVTRNINQFIEFEGDPKWIPHGFGSWNENVKSYLAVTKQYPCVILRYEDLKANPSKILKEIANFLQIEVTLEQVKAAVQQSSLAVMSQLENQEIQNRATGLFYTPSLALSYARGYRFVNNRLLKEKLQLSSTQKQAFQQAFAPLMEQLEYSMDDKRILSVPQGSISQDDSKKSGLELDRVLADPGLSR